MPYHWMGTLPAGKTGMRVLVHLRELPDGRLEGSLDNLDVGRIGIPLDGASFHGDHLRFSAPEIGGSYEGRVASDGRTVEGVWRMDEDSSRLVLRPVTPSDIDGVWTGGLQWQSMRLRLVFYVASGPHGLIASMKSRDQDDAVVPIGAVRRFGSALILEAPDILARFDGVLDESLDAIEGTWEQGGARMPLALKRVAQEDESPMRPQEPVGPYPYREIEVTYRNPRAGCDLAGTFTIPDGDGPFPAVLLVSGSGKHDRNGSMFDHQPFLVLADYLSRRGVAVLRTDDRGVGESGGEFHLATTSDLATDAESALEWLRNRPEVDRTRVGLIGHSEGALISSMVASQDHEVGFIVLMAGPGVPGWEIAAKQARRQAELYGANGEAAGQLHGDLAAILRHQKDPVQLRRLLHQRLASVPEEQRERMVDNFTNPWLRQFVSLDPAEFLRRVRCPVLAILGAKDTILESKANLETIRAALEEAGNQRHETVELPGLNHLLQTCETGAPSEYAQIEETLSPLALDKIHTWVQANA